VVDGHVDDVGGREAPGLAEDPLDAVVVARAVVVEDLSVQSYVKPVSARAASRMSRSVYPLLTPRVNSSNNSRAKFSFGSSLSELSRSRNRCIAWSRSSACASLRKLPSALPRIVQYWLSISLLSETFSFDVAKWSCQLSVIRSTSWWRPRTIRSSHQSTSCP